ALHLRVGAGLALDHLVDEREDALLDELDQPLEHLRLAREVAIERRFRDVEARGERCGGDAIGTRLLQHRRQRLEDLDAPLAGTRALACRYGGRWRRRLERREQRRRRCFGSFAFHLARRVAGEAGRRVGGTDHWAWVSLRS